MAATEWFKRGHAARIRAAAHAAGFEVNVVPGFKIQVTAIRDGVEGMLLRAEFNPRTGQLQPTSVRTRLTRPDFPSYARHTGATPADVARDVIGWLAAGAPQDWPHLPTTLQMQVAAAQRPITRPVIPEREATSSNVIPFRRNR